MKIKPMGPSPGVVPHGMRGVQFRATKWGWIAQAKPQKAKKPRSTLQRQYETRFMFAGRMASSPPPLEALTAIEMAKGTHQVPRDVLTMMATGRYYAFQWPDGTFMRHCEKPTINDPLCVRPQSMLLQKTILPWDVQYLSIGNGWRLQLK